MCTWALAHARPPVSDTLTVKYHKQYCKSLGNSSTISDTAHILFPKVFHAPKRICSSRHVRAELLRSMLAQIWLTQLLGYYKTCSSAKNNHAMGLDNKFKTEFWCTRTHGHELQSGQHWHTSTALIFHRFVFTFQFSRLLDRSSNYIMFIYQLHLYHAKFTMIRPSSMAALG